jgi:hypothetical protein
VGQIDGEVTAQIDGDYLVIIIFIWIIKHNNANNNSSLL